MKPLRKPTTNRQPMPFNNVNTRRSTALPSVGLGTLRTRWTRLSIGAGELVTLNLNCWRVALAFTPGLGLIWDGIKIKDVIGQSGIEPVTFTVGGAMYEGRPVYLNESHSIGSSGDAEILVIEEFFDGATRPNN